ncbi:MAG: hypothetical protein ACOCWZ_10420 [Spirochaetota bacterium]
MKNIETNKRFIFKFLAGLLVILFAGGCATEYTLNLPDSFAVYSREKKVYKAITAGGVKVRSFQVENDPEGSVEMWLSAIDIHLKSGGYQLVSSEDFTSPQNFDGKMAEYKYMYNGKDYTYLIAILLNHDKIYVIESGGLQKRVAEYKKEIISSMKNFSTGNTH